MSDEEEFKDETAEAETQPASDPFAEAFEKAYAEQDNAPPETDLTGQASDKAPAQPETATSLEPLRQWPEDVKTRFKALPVEMQQFMLERHKETDTAFHSKSQELAKRAARYSELDEVMQENADVLATVGRTVPQLVQESINLHQFAARNPMGFLQWFCERNGIAPQQLAQQQQQRVQQVNPETAALQERLEELSTWKTELEQRAEQQEAERQNADLSAWAYEKGPDGKPVRPHVDALIKRMVPIIQYIRSEQPQKPHREILQEAYDQAAYADPTIRTQILNDERMAKVRAAKNAGSSIAPSGKGVPAAPKGFDGAFERAWEEMNQR